MMSEAEQGTGQISFDVPADLMAVSGRADLEAVGAGVSQTLAGLRKHLGGPVPGELTDAAAGGRVFAAAAP
jgi:hypothetical protein